MMNVCMHEGVRSWLGYARAYSGLICVDRDSTRASRHRDRGLENPLRMHITLITPCTFPGFPLGVVEPLAPLTAAALAAALSGEGVGRWANPQSEPPVRDSPRLALAVSMLN